MAFEANAAVEGAAPAPAVEQAPAETAPVEAVETIVDNMTPEQHMRFDPFAEEPVVEAGGGQAAPVQQAPLGAAPTLPGATAPTVPAIPIETQLAMLQDQVNQGQQPAAVAPGEAPVEAPLAAPAVVPQPNEALNTMLAAYDNFAVPPELTEAINSSDPQVQAQGLQAIMIGVARAVTQQLHGHFTPQIEGMGGQINETVQGLMQAQSVFTDFYGAYPALNNAQYLPLVQATMAQMIKEPQFANMAYGPQLREELGARVARLLNTTPDGLRAQNRSLPQQPGGQLINGSARPGGVTEPLSDPSSTMLASLGEDPRRTLGSI